MFRWPARRHSYDCSTVQIEKQQHSRRDSHITDLELQHNPIGNEGAIRLARSLGNNTLPNLTGLSLCSCGIDDVALVSALEQNTSLLQLDLRHEIFDTPGFSERCFLALAESLPEINSLQEFGLCLSTGLASAMPSLLAGLRKNTSLFRFHIAPSSVLRRLNSDRYDADWIQETESLGCRNRFLSLILALIRAPKETLPPLGIWPHALARVAALPDVIFEVLRSKPKLVPSEDTKGKEAVEVLSEDTGG
jgi:hypothetical protein